MKYFALRCARTLEISLTSPERFSGMQIGPPMWMSGMPTGSRSTIDSVSSPDWFE